MPLKVPILHVGIYSPFRLVTYSKCVFSMETFGMPTINQNIHKLVAQNDSRFHTAITIVPNYVLTLFLAQYANIIIYINCS